MVANIGQRTLMTNFKLSEKGECSAKGLSPWTLHFLRRNCLESFFRLTNQQINEIAPEK